MRKLKVRHVKFSPEEMAYDVPPEIDFGRGAVFDGVEEWQRFLSFRRGFVRLGDDLRKRFKDDEEVRQALREYVQIRELVGKRHRKSA